MVKTKIAIQERQEALNRISSLRLLGPCSKYSNNLKDILKISKNVQVTIGKTDKGEVPTTKPPNKRDQHG
jgi:hypothetical protein